MPVAAPPALNKKSPLLQVYDNPERKLQGPTDNYVGI